MTPKEKAKELVDKYYQLAESIEWTADAETKAKAEQLNDELGNDVLKYWNLLAKESVLIAVDEILEMDLPILEEDADTFYDSWEEVKQEIEIFYNKYMNQ